MPYCLTALSSLGLLHGCLDPPGLVTFLRLSLLFPLLGNCGRNVKSRLCSSSWLYLWYQYYSSVRWIQLLNKASLFLANNFKIPEARVTASDIFFLMHHPTSRQSKRSKRESLDFGGSKIHQNHWHAFTRGAHPRDLSSRSFRVSYYPLILHLSILWSKERLVHLNARFS